VFNQTTTVTKKLSVSLCDFHCALHRITLGEELGAVLGDTFGEKLGDREEWRSSSAQHLEQEPCRSGTWNVTGACTGDRAAGS
jgi:hypothetical protein